MTATLFTGLPRAVRIVEVGPRDGLQNEPRSLRPVARATLVRELWAAGLRHVEIGAFVSPRRVPQMAGTAEVAAATAGLDGLVRSALVANERGLAAALASGVEEIAVFTAASETFCRRNINCGIAESLARFRPLVAEARAAGLAVRGYLSCIAVCPFEGSIAPERVVPLVEALLEMGCGEVSLGDTVGRASPRAIDHLLGALAGSVPAHRLALHAHDTHRMALANVVVGLAHGLGVFDAAVAGLGGCPFAPGAGGNLATADLVRLLEAMGVSTGVDLAALGGVGERIRADLGHAPMATPTGAGERGQLPDETGRG